MEQLEGFEVKSDAGEKPVHKPTKSLYSRKQLGRKWGKKCYMSTSVKMVPHRTVFCVYDKGIEGERVKIWVDELIIAANYSDPVNDVKEMLSANEHGDEESWET